MTNRWRDLVPEGCTWPVPGKAGISGKPLSLLIIYGLLHKKHAILRLVAAHAMGCFDSFSNETQLISILAQTSSRHVHVMRSHLPHK